MNGCKYVAGRHNIHHDIYIIQEYDARLLIQLVVLGVMSAILSADDLNDFILPGLACIKPLKQAPEEQENYGEVEIQIDQNGKPLEISKIDGRMKELSPAQINLSDCLACAGCITSAEEILVAQHNHEELIKALTKRDKVFVVSVSHQSRSSLATAFDIDITHVDQLLINLFINQMGFQYIVGTGLGRKLSLIEQSQELINKKEFKRKENDSNSDPILSSICPGWVLYAEKTHPYILPKLSTIKSPQQITGCLLKNIVSKELNLSNSNIYHLSIMPCFDKKLESARPEKGQEEASEKDVDVDCVLTAKELITLLNQYDQYQFLTKVYDGPIDYALVAPKSWPFPTLSWSNDSGSTSGGYGLNYLQAYKGFLVKNENYAIDSFNIETHYGKNSDMYQINLTYNGEVIANTAIVNGFKNIQNLVRKFKPGKIGKINPLSSRRKIRNGESVLSSIDASKCDYVEIMACPSGCINGGGQISHGDGNEKEWLDKLIKNYESIATIDLFNDEKVLNDINDFIKDFNETFKIVNQRLFHTWFKEVEKETDPNAIMVGTKW